MKTFRHLFLLLCLILPGSALAQGETTLKAGESFGLRISGVPADEVQLVSAQYGISDAGTIRLPYLKISIQAAGLKPSALARKIEAAYRSAEDIHPADDPDRLDHRDHRAAAFPECHG